MGPRLCGRGDSIEPDVSLTSMIELQWGRAFVGAEMSVGPVRSDYQGTASMGPRLCGRGDLSGMRSIEDSTELQWGRAFVGAEIDACASSSDLRAGFNGAAPLWARRCGWIGRRGTPTGASMGPRLCGRGDGDGLGGDEVLPRGGFNGAAPLWARRSRKTLSGARDSLRFNGAAPLWARRSRKASYVSESHSGFNGAAPLWARRWPHHHHGHQHEHASMGPRLCGRGDWCLRASPGGPGLASMGPRLCGRGDGAALWAALQHGDASMGPRLCGRGDPGPGAVE